MLCVQIAADPTAVNVQVRLADVERRGVGWFADPFQHLSVFRMLRIPDDLTIVCVAVDASDVLRRARPPSGLDDGIPSVIPWREKRFENHLVLPAITEVILILTIS